MTTGIVATMLAIAMSLAVQSHTAGSTETLTVPTFGRVVVYPSRLSAVESRLITEARCTGVRSPTRQPSRLKAT